MTTCSSLGRGGSQGNVFVVSWYWDGTQAGLARFAGLEGREATEVATVGWDDGVELPRIVLDDGWLDASCWLVDL